MINVTVLLLEGTLASTAIGPIDVFGHAGVLWNICTGSRPSPYFKVTTASIDGHSVRCDGGVQIKPQRAIGDVRKTDLIFVPSIGLDMAGSIARHGVLLRWLRRWHKRGAAIAAVCSGTGFLAASGLLDGKRATTHWGLAEGFRELYPKVLWMPELMITQEGGLFCGAGVNAALDLSVYLIERYCGHEVAIQTAKSMLVETSRAWQAGFAVVPLRTEHSDPEISKAQEWLHQNFRRTFGLEEPAAHAGLGLRTFLRRFKDATGDSPLVYLQKLRVAAAKRLLESDHRSIQEIGEAVGYQDVAFFRALFQRHAGVHPSAYRQKFGVERAMSKAAS